MYFSQCDQCKKRLHIGDDAYQFRGDNFCSRVCFWAWVYEEVIEYKISESDCTLSDKDGK